MEESMEVLEQEHEAEMESAWEDDRAAGAPGEPAREETEAPSELFTLKNRDETRQVNRDEVIAMAQKGWDYDTVRAERDQLRQFRSQAAPALEMVQANARKNGMTVPQYLDFCRKQDLMRGGLDERSAAQTLQMEKQKDELDARRQQENSLIQRIRAQQAGRRQDMERFLQAYPDVKAESIPKEVWAQVSRGASLVSAYAMHENRQLKAQLAAERQNKANRLRTPGSLGANTGAELDEIDRMWGEED